MLLSPILQISSGTGEVQQGLELLCQVSIDLTHIKVTQLYKQANIDTTVEPTQ